MHMTRWIWGTKNNDLKSTLRLNTLKLAYYTENRIIT